MEADISHLVDPSDLINKSVAARLIGVSQPTISKRIQSGDLRSIKRDGMEYVFRSEVMELPPPQRPPTICMSNAELVNSLLMLADHMGRLPENIEYRQQGDLCISTITKRIGTWARACELAHRQGQPFWKDAECQQCGRTFTARISQRNPYGAKNCSHSCQRDADQGRPKTVILNGEKFTVRSKGHYISTRTPSRALHRVIWESHYGEIPAHHQLHFHDGNRENCRIENLYLKELKPAPPCKEPGCPRKGAQGTLWCERHQRASRRKRTS
jgi:hypothetical protein